jgi:uncharacterized protein YndB with AHSA1/START domain
MSTGLTADGGYQAGVRRSFAVGSEVAWLAWGEGLGLARWVGTFPQPLAEKAQASLADGTRVTVVRVEPPRYLRLRLEHPDWPRKRTVQLRVLPSVHGVTVALHAEGLGSASDRQAVLARWTRALENWDAFSGRDVAEIPPGPSIDEEDDSPRAEPPKLEEGLARRVATSVREKVAAVKKRVAKKAAAHKGASEAKGPARKTKRTAKAPARKPDVSEKKPSRSRK